VWNETYETRGQRVSTVKDIDGTGTLIVTVRDKDGTRQEHAQWGPLWIECGNLRLESTDHRDEMETEYGYSASPDDLDQPGGQDAGVWVWKIPPGANGKITVEADTGWPRWLAAQST
jgi:hypothetical protein